MPLRAVVVGAGAWGAAAAAVLASRGAAVTLLDAATPGHARGSSGGATRIWRLAHPDGVRVRLAQRSVEAWRRLEKETGTTLLVQTGILWRDDDGGVGAVGAALAGEGVAHTAVAQGDVGRFLPGLVADGRGAIFQPEAGAVLADAAIDAHMTRFAAAGGVLRTNTRVTSVAMRPQGGVRVDVEGGAPPLEADVAVVAPGAGAPTLLPSLDARLASLPFGPRVQQVAHFSPAAGVDASDVAAWPAWFDGPTPAASSLYAMPSPQALYKLGLDDPVRALPSDDDGDRTPCAAGVAALAARVAASLPLLSPAAHTVQVCTWTDSPDGRFVVDAVGDGRVVVAAGCSGEGFKFSVVVGDVCADLAAGRTADADVASFGLARFEGREAGGAAPRHVLGR